MFTDPPRLVERIARKFDDTRLVDPFSQIRLDQPSAASLAELMAHPGIQAELKSVGMPADAMASTKEPLDRVKAALNYLPNIRNTATSWRFFRILNDLYDFTDPIIDHSNVQKLADQVEASHQRPDWAKEVLGEKSRVDIVVTNLQNRSSGLNSADAEDALGVTTRYYLDASFLLSHKVYSRDPHKKAAKPSYVSSLMKTLGESPSSFAHLNRLVNEWLDNTLTGQVLYTTARLPMKFRFSGPDEGSVNHLLERANSDISLTDDESDQLVHATAWAILGWHHENRKTFQIMATGHSPFQPTTCPAMMTNLFQTFSGATFAILSGTSQLAFNINHLAAQVPNVAQVGNGKSGFVTDLIAYETALRLQVAPASKTAAFLSHAPSVEWTYGNLQVIRRGLAKALAAIIEDDYIHERQVPDTLRQILNRSPRAIYGLS